LLLEIANGHEGSQAPISDEERGTNNEQPAEANDAEEDAGTKITNGDALKDAHPADVIQAFGDSAINHQAENVKNEAAKQNSFQGGGPAVAFEHPAEREDDGNADNENEQGKNQVVKSDTLPGFVIHLRIQQAERADGPGIMKGMDKFVATDDPEHVKSAEGIQREQTLAGNRRRSLS